MLNKVLLDFCNEINNQKPLLVNVFPADDALVHECIDNVSEYIKVNSRDRCYTKKICFKKIIFTKYKYKIWRISN